jgi:hypothetical protein
MHSDENKVAKPLAPLSSPGWQDHELLHGQCVARMDPAIDDVEAWYRQVLQGGVGEAAASNSSSGKNKHNITCREVREVWQWLCQ